MKLFRTAIIVIAALVVATALIFSFRSNSENPAARSFVASPGEIVKSITVEPEVKLEVIDFGGSGRPVVLLAGLGNTARTLQDFARALIHRYRVYGITRRGFGGSSVPRTGYSAHRLGDDVVSVIDQLGLHQPVLVGHSVAGEELSSVAAYHPDKVAGLVYLEAGYSPYALRDERSVNLAARIAWVAKAVSWVLPAGELQAQAAIVGGQEGFTKIALPVLAIYADPHDLSSRFKNQPASLAKARERDRKRTDQMVEVFARQVPLAQIVRLPGASHAVFRSNQTEVINAIDGFISRLP